MENKHVLCRLTTEGGGQYLIKIGDVPTGNPQNLGPLHPETWEPGPGADFDAQFKRWEKSLEAGVNGLDDKEIYIPAGVAEGLADFSVSHCFREPWKRIQEVKFFGKAGMIEDGPLAPLDLTEIRAAAEKVRLYFVNPENGSPAGEGYLDPAKDGLANYRDDFDKAPALNPDYAMELIGEMIIERETYKNIAGYERLKAAAGENQERKTIYFPAATDSEIIIPRRGELSLRFTGRKLAEVPAEKPPRDGAVLRLYRTAGGNLIFEEHPAPLGDPAGPSRAYVVPENEGPHGHYEAAGIIEKERFDDGSVSPSLLELLRDAGLEVFEDVE